MLFGSTGRGEETGDFGTHAEHSASAVRCRHPTKSHFRIGLDIPGQHLNNDLTVRP